MSSFKEWRHTQYRHLAISLHVLCQFTEIWHVYWILLFDTKLANGEHNHTPTARMPHKFPVTNAGYCGCWKYVPTISNMQETRVHMWWASLFRSSNTHYHREEEVETDTEESWLVVQLCRPLIPISKSLSLYAVIFNDPNGCIFICCWSCGILLSAQRRKTQAKHFCQRLFGFVLDKQEVRSGKIQLWPDLLTSCTYELKVTDMQKKIMM